MCTGTWNIKIRMALDTVVNFALNGSNFFFTYDGYFPFCKNFLTLEEWTKLFEKI